jgi:hypothetical protein
MIAISQLGAYMNATEAQQTVDLMQKLSMIDIQPMDLLLIYLSLLSGDTLSLDAYLADITQNTQQRLIC